MSEHGRLVERGARLRVALLSALLPLLPAACSPRQTSMPEATSHEPATAEVGGPLRAPASPNAKQPPAAAADQLEQRPAKKSAPGSGAIYDIGPLPRELGLRLPARPFTNSEKQVSTNEQFEQAATISGTHVIVTGNLRGRVAIKGSDIKVTMRGGGEIENLTIEHGCKRVELDGGRYASILLALPAEFAPAERSRPEWAVEDVIIDGVEVHAPGMAFEIYGKRIAIVRSKAFAGTYSIWSGPVFGLGNEDILIAGNNFQSAGPQATVRLVNATRSVTVDNTLRNSYKHNYRVHGPSRLAYAARNTFINTGVMFGTGEDQIDRMWFDDNTFFQEAPDLFNTDVGHIQVLHAVGNTAYTDRHHCFWCEPVPAGWTIERNQLKPYRKPPPERAPAP